MKNSEQKKLNNNENLQLHEKYMQMAINQSLKAYKRGDVPVGAVVVSEHGKVLAKAYNKKHKKQNALYHSEVLAINKACKKVKNFRLENATIYVTKEPCLMCVGAILSARLSTIVFGSYDKKYGAISLATENNFNHTCEVVGGVLEQQNSKIMSDFFKRLRENKKVKNKTKKQQ